MHPTTSNTIVTATILIDVVVFIFLSPLVLIMFSSDLFCISRLQTYNTIIPEIGRWINLTNPYSSAMLQIHHGKIGQISDLQLVLLLLLSNIIIIVFENIGKVSSEITLYRSSRRI